MQSQVLDWLLWVYLHTKHEGLVHATFRNKTAKGGMLCKPQQATCDSSTSGLARLNYNFQTSDV